MPEINHVIAGELADNWSLFRDINGLAGQNAPLDQVMIFGANDLIFLLPLLAALIWLLVARWSPYVKWMRSRFGSQLAERARWIGQRAAINAALATAVAVGLGAAISTAIVEPRPFVSYPTVVHQLIPHAADNSFPSDHETVAMAIALALVIGAIALLWASLREPLIGKAAGWGWRRAVSFTLLPGLIALIAFLAAALVGFARIYDGVHYPHDIAGGALLGLAGALIAQILVRPFNALYRLIVRVAEVLRLA